MLNPPGFENCDTICFSGKGNCCYVSSISPLSIESHWILMDYSLIFLPLCVARTVVIHLLRKRPSGPHRL